MQYILQEKKTTVTDDREKKEYTVNVSYHRTITNALQSYKELQIRNSNVTLIDELMKLIKELDEKIEKLLGGN
jgi:regulator of PEP synthase PpsR (kinase-PPPase family)